MLYIIRSHDKEDQGKVRQDHLQSHIAWLDQHKDIVLVGGSLRHEPDEAPVGGMWIVDAESKERVEGLLQTDPFWIHGLRKGYEIFYWTKVFPNRKALM